MAEEWHGINDPGYFRKPVNAEDKPKPKPAPEPIKPREPLAKEYKFKDVTIIEPAQGFELNKPFDIEGEIEPYGDKVKASKILLSPIGIYNNKEDNFAPGGIEASLNQSTWKFKATCKSLYEPDSFARDDKKSADATWKLFVRAEGKAAEKSLESERFTFPRASKFVELKKGDYDEDGAKKYNKSQSGENFKPHSVVKSLQGDLIKIGLLPKDSDDGYFGDQTEKAIKDFQNYAIKSERLKQNAGKIETTTKPLDQQNADGIVNKKTRDEIDTWLKNNWIKPVLTLRHGEYDQNGTNGDDRPREGDNFHSGDPILENQKSLQKVNVYTDFTLDGWFHNYMLEAVQQFQDAAEKGTLTIDGKPADLGEKLTKYQKGILCPKTQAHLELAIKSNAKVINEIIIIPMRFPLDAKYNDKGYVSGERAFGSSRNHGKRAHAGCDLYAPVGEKIFAVDDGVITKYRDFYGQTFALEIDHGTYIVRYGEVQPPNAYNAYKNDPPPEKDCNGLPSDLKETDPVTKGQHIAFVGQLRLDKDKNGKLHNYPRSMLHFELYKKESSGSLTITTKTTYKHVIQRNYQRRDDLIDPTKSLEQTTKE